MGVEMYVRWSAYGVVELSEDGGQGHGMRGTAQPWGCSACRMSPLGEVAVVGVDAAHHQLPHTA